MKARSVIRRFFERLFLGVTEEELQVQGIREREILSKAKKLVAHNKRLKLQVRYMNEQARIRNLQLDALRFVWGSTVESTLRPPSLRINGAPLTEDLVSLAEANTRRMRQLLELQQSENGLK